MSQPQEKSNSGITSRANWKLFERISLWLRDFLDHVQPSEDVVLVVTAVIVGIGAGVGTIILRYMIKAVAAFGYEWVPQHFGDLGKLYVIVVPALGGLLVGLLVYRFAREAKGHGVPQVIEAIALRGGRIGAKVTVIKAITSALTIGSGGSAGREGPIVHIGAGVGSTVGQMLHLSEDRVINLIACGAAGGIAATFNAPIAGILFALEIILGEFSVRYFSNVVISAVVASVIGRAVFGESPAFLVPVPYGVNSLWEFAFYPVLGVLAALVAVAFVRLLFWTEDRFEHWENIPEWVKPALGGMLLGIVALIYPVVTGVTWERVPQIFNVGYDVMIENALGNHLLLGAVLVLLTLKLVATCLTLGSGGSGGIFAPTLFMGAMLGTAFQLVIDSIFPNVASPPGAYAMLGMAAVMAATAHAPITAILLLFEVTGDYRMILPLMLTVVIATLLARLMLNNESIDTLKLSRRGIRLQHRRDIDVMQGVTVAEAMQTPPPTISGHASLQELRDTLRAQQIRSLAVVDEHQHLCGMVSLSDLQRAYESIQPGENSERLSRLTVGDICNRDVITIKPDDVLWRAVRTLGARGIGRLPVVSGSHVIGMIGRQDIMKAYNMAIERKIHDQHMAEQIRLNTLTGAHVIQLLISHECLLENRFIRDIPWPGESLIASIKRNNRLIVPHGYTQLKVNDLLIIVTDPSEEEQLRALCQHSSKSDDST